MDDELRIPHYVKRALRRLEKGSLLVRQAASTDEAVERGNGHLYFTHPDGKAFGSASGAYVVSNGLVEPTGDGLFAGDSQTYRLAAQ